jgi:hypothetical protein
MAGAKGAPEVREYRVKPVLRYIITEHVEMGGISSGPRQLGEYDNRDLAWVVADGIAKANGGFAIIPNADYRALAAKLTEEYGIVGG